MRATRRPWSTRSSRLPSRSRRSARRGSRRSWPTMGITVTRRWSGLRPSASAATSRSRTAADGTGRARRRPGGRGVCQPPADPRRTRETAAAAAGELVERPNAHLYETGRMRRVHLRGHPNILKRLLVQVCGVNLGLLMRHLTGVGTPRSLQGRAAARLGALIGLLSGCWRRVRRFWAPERHDRPIRRGMVRRHANTDTRFSIDNQPLLPRAARRS